jgi:probable HAF family extracellular repeat protein
MNGRGDAAGIAWVDPYAGTADAVVVVGGQEVDAGWSVSGQVAQANGIAPDGSAVGHIFTNTVNGFRRATAWTLAGQQIRLPDYGRESDALGVNRVGDIVGWADGDNAPIKAVRWSHGQLTVLAPNAEAYAINDLGVAVGSGGGQGWAPVVFAHGKAVPLGSIGGTWGFAYAINDAGHIAGVATIAGDAIEHAFVYADGTMRDLGVLPGRPYTAATGINADDVIIGYAWDTDTQHPVGVVWLDGVIHRLTDLLDPATGAGWQIWLPLAVNDAGQICANGNHGAMVLTPMR